MRQTQDKDFRVLLVDDHPVVAAGLKIALRDMDIGTFMGCASTPHAAITMIAAEKPDALILDLSFNGRIELPLIEKCRSALPEAIIVVFTSLPPRTYRVEAIRWGADAFVSKETDLETLVEILFELRDRPRTAEPESMRLRGEEADLEEADGVYLTPRERDVARLLSRGASVAHIASIIGVSMKTAAAHRDNLRKKFGCRESNELIARLARIFGNDDK